MTAAFSALSGGCPALAPLSACPFVSAVTSVASLSGVRAVIAGDGVSGSGSDAEQSLRLGDDLRDAERLSAHLVVADGIDEVARPDQHQQLTEVDLGDQHAPVVPEDRLGIRRERVEMAQV